VSQRVVVVGASLGGLEALGTLLDALPENFPLAIVVAQHRRADAASGLPGLLQSRSRLPISEPEDKSELIPGHVYIAPPDYHLLVGPEGLSLSVDGPVFWARPSIDVLFESAAYAFGAGTIAVALTGASPDGAEGAAQVARAGGTVLVQDPDEALSPILPLAVLERVRAEKLSLAKIAARLVELAGADS
jgi:two-component system chemotaxis response regulator CheB